MRNQVLIKIQHQNYLPQAILLWTFGILLFTLSSGCVKQNIQDVQAKPRTIVTCDPELDDNNSMIRFILHATDFQIDILV